ncbi:MAG: LL-diaminopimelate aminotransferase [Candidatus Altiarchaeota archaeon]|nr:LL-diaminopimelate aminotransferase [Candidatus Altiarchaeota archaeon]
MNYAQRIERIPPYLFAEIDRAIEEKKAGGMDVISLGIGDPDLPTPKNIIDEFCQRAYDPMNHRYPSYAGMPSFREAVAGWYKKRFNVSLDAEKEVLTLIGSKEGIAHTPLAFINPGDIALVPDPAYPVYKIGTILADGNPIEMPLLEENGFLPDLSRISNETAGKARILYLNYPNNPTTAVADKKFFREVVDFANENNIIVCHDAPYTEMTFDDYKTPSFLEVDGAMDVGVEFHSLSKTYNMTGWRIGFAVGNHEVISGLGRVKENVDSGVFQAIQYAGVEALTGPQDSVENNKGILRERRDLMVDGLNDLGWGVNKPKATFYLWFKTPGKYTSSIKFSRDLLDKTGVVMTPGVGFGKYGEGFVRCALTQSKERLIEALKRLKKLDI